MYMHVQGMLLLLVSRHVYGRLGTLLTLDECHVVSWSDKCTYDCVLYRMVRLPFTLPARKDMDQLLNYYFKQNTQMSVSVRRYDTNTLAYIATGSIPYSRKYWRGIIFGGLVDFLSHCQY